MIAKALEAEDPVVTKSEVRRAQAEHRRAMVSNVDQPHRPRGGRHRRRHRRAAQRHLRRAQSAAAYQRLLVQRDLEHIQHSAHRASRRTPAPMGAAFVARQRLACPPPPPSRAQSPRLAKADPPLTPHRASAGLTQNAVAPADARRARATSPTNHAVRRDITVLTVQPRNATVGRFMPRAVKKAAPKPKADEAGAHRRHPEGVRSTYIPKPTASSTSRRPFSFWWPPSSPRSAPTRA